MTDKWWLLGGDRKPIGPLTPEFLLEGIVAGNVSLDSLICVVGGAEWQVVSEVARFASAVIEASTQPAGTHPESRRRSRNLLDLEESTIVDGIPLWPAEGAEIEPAASTHRDQRMGFDDPEERTLVDAPLRRSDPPE